MLNGPAYSHKARMAGDEPLTLAGTEADEVVPSPCPPGPHGRPVMRGDEPVGQLRRETSLHGVQSCRAKTENSGLGTGHRTTRPAALADLATLLPPVLRPVEGQNLASRPPVIA